jgi:glutathione S-transferase
MLELVIGDKNLSSWSMRPWLVMKRAGADFSERVVRLNREDTAAEIRKYSPTAQVPALRDGDVTVWDSMAISVHIAEKFPQARLWPADPVARTLARAAACEMHSGFASLRGECPMNLKRRVKVEVSERTQNDLRRLVELWSDLRGRFGADGPFLCGTWSIADAFYTPVATRIRTYGLPLSDYGDTGVAGEYVSTLLQTPEFLEWEEAALADPEAEA